MYRLFFLGFFTFCTPLQGADPALQPPAMVANVDNGRARVKLWEAPCVDREITPRIHPEGRSKWQKGEARVYAEIYSMCWQQMGRTIWFIYGDGDVGSLDAGLFKPEYPI